MQRLKTIDPEIFKIIKDEIERQNNTLELIASENFTSHAVLAAQGSVLTNKYAEGYPKRRWYGGCVNVDLAEELAIERAKKLFKAEHVNVQAHSGAQANMAVFFACLNIGDTVLAMDLACGGHLTHGHPLNFSGRFFKIVTYGVHHETEMLDYDEILEKAKEHKPKLILAGASAYPRTIDFKKFRFIADSVNAILMVDMAHIAGLVAAGMHPSPVPYADFVSSTTHKTLRGPRGGFILCKDKYSKIIDTQIFPGIQGGPLMHVIAAKAVAFKEAQTKEFKSYQKDVVDNAKALSAALEKFDFRIVSGGTDNHLMLVDLTNKSISGRDAQEILENVGITVNKNLIPFDKKSAIETSGIRLGTPSLTTRGMKIKQMQIIAELISGAIDKKDNKKEISSINEKVKSLVKKFPLYQDPLK